MFNKKLKEENKKLRANGDDLFERFRAKEIEVAQLKSKLNNAVIEPESNPDLPWANHEMGVEERTARAKELLSNPLMREIFDGIEDGLIKKLSEADLSNHVELIAYTQGLQIREQMIKYIEDRVNDQKVVEFNLQQAAKARL